MRVARGADGIVLPYPAAPAPTRCSGCAARHAPAGRAGSGCPAARPGGVQAAGTLGYGGWAQAPLVATGPAATRGLRRQLAKKIRVYELARELGLTNKEALDLSLTLGIGVRSHSSSIEDAQADRVRRKADQLGLRRAQQPPEPEPAVSSRPAASTPGGPHSGVSPTGDAALGRGQRAVEVGARGLSGGADDTGGTAPPRRLVTSRPAAELGRGPGEVRPIATPAGGPPGAPTSPHPPAPVPGAERTAPERTASERPRTERPGTPGAERAGSPRPPVGGSGVAVPASPPLDRPPATLPEPVTGPASAVQAAATASATAAPAAAPVAPPGAGSAPAPPAPPAPAPAASSGAAAPTAPRRIPPPPGGPPLSRSGRPIPPPPGGPPLSRSGRPIPPPPGPRVPMDRAGAMSGRSGPPSRGPAGARPAPGGAGRVFPGAPRPGPGGARPAGGFGAGRTSSLARPGAPAGAPGGFGGRGAPARGRPPQRSGRRRPRRNREELEPTQLTVYSPSNAPVPEGEVIIERGSTAQDVGPKLNRSAGDVVRFLLLQGEMVTATQSLSEEMIELFAAEVGAKVRLVDPGEEQEAQLQARFFEEDDEEEDESALVVRPPVVTVMGHVDHGKTLLLDRIRSANVVAGEAGGITQHIGAYQVDVAGQRITFIDTPGHEAFTAMRARGAEVTDIVVLVVAADDGVMPQTVEAINHARAADVPIVVALNKIDRADADPNRVMQQLSEHGLVPEGWGGDTITVEISALQNLGIDDLLEQLLVLAEVLELRANPTGRARGVVLEANLDPGRGPVATVIVERGTLEVGDWVVAGAAWGRVKALLDERGKAVKGAGPSTPVQVLGFSDVPAAGDELRVTPDQGSARTIGEARAQRQRLAGHAATPAPTPGAKLEDLIDQIRRGETATLNLILKADVQGSLEALTESLRRLEREDVKLTFVHRAVGGVTENDVTLAAASNATIIGFNVRPDRRARELAEASDVEIRTYEIIYKVIEDMQAAMVGMLAPETEEVVTGEAEVREIFRVPRVGAVAGCYVRHGALTRGSKVRFLRDGAVIWKGTISSLRRFKDDVREVATGFECGVGLSDFQDLRAGDVIETFEDREVPRT